MAHHLAHENNNYGEFRDVRYTYDELNRLINVNDLKQDVFDEMFAYDAQGRIVAQRRAGNVVNPTGGEYSYYSGKNRLKTVADNMGGTADERIMSDTANFVYDSVGNLTYDKYLQGEGSKNALVHFYCRTVVYCALRNSKELEILYDWRGMPIEFIQQSQPAGSSSDTLFRLLMKYDGTGRRISKTMMHKVAGAADWDTAQVTHYTGIGTEIREDFSKNQTKVVVNMPEGFGRYGIEDAEKPDFDGMTGNGLVGYIPNAKFEWYLKNHLGSTMLVYGSQSDANPAHADIGTPLAAYDYRAFGEMVELTPPSTGKVTENFTGKEHDEEIKLNYFGARYLDPMLGMWISVDPARQFSSPYLYAGNGYNPVNGVDPDGNVLGAENQEIVGLINEKSYHQFRYENGLVQECLVCRDNPSGSLNYSQRISSAIQSENFGEIINEGLSSRERFYANKNGGAVTSIERGHPTAVVTNGNAQDALHELSSHVIPAMLEDRPGNGSVLNEELMNSPGYQYLSPLDIPDHPIDQIHYDIVE